MATVGHPEMESFDAGDTMRSNFLCFCRRQRIFLPNSPPPTGSKLKTKEIGDDYALHFGGKETGVNRGGLTAGYR